ncbi:hypothetical protein OIDMADRAFT_21331 [Oidiodendron maius Zn]|uniref:Uncharacterized protein n=1 Tax=Oidiodendron maius (strain Zn) TaxID=913774 RepID=A0A0C3C6M1_OIDMZ|nr:hypothetical protein OIDMADRAFT_21331 [Oidiodendron maius Zn]
MSDVLKPPSYCRYCNGLNFGSSPVNVPFDEWVSGISTSSCQTCQIIAQAIRKLSPQFLEGKFSGKTSGSHPHTNVRLSIHDRCRVIVGIEQNERLRRELDVQFYYSLTDNG